MDHNVVLQEARDYGAFLKKQRLALLSADSLAGISSRNFTSWGPHPALFAKLISEIQAKRAFSLIRLGDGEGNVLFWGFRRIDYPNLARFCMDGIWSVMFGSPGRIGDYDRLSDSMVLAADDADYVGISEIHAYERSMALICDCPAEDLDIRGQSGAAAVWDWISGRMQGRDEESGQILINAWFHSDLDPDSLQGILNAAQSLSLITCHPTLMDRFVSAFGIRQGSTYLISPQFSNTGERQAAVQYPDRFEQISADLGARDLTGSLFLVGAGIVGKIYCNLIKKRGGMAIDAGSMMDVWMGIGVRKYQDAAFVQKRQLP